MVSDLSARPGRRFQLALASLAFLALAAPGTASAAPGIQMPLRLLFALVDSDGDGRVTKTEAHTLADRIFDQLDTNRDGAITRAEVDAMRQRVAANDKRGAETNKAFDEIDRNKDGKVTAKEWNARFDQEFARLDADHDGVITLADLSGRDLEVPAGAAGVLMP